MEKATEKRLPFSFFIFQKENIAHQKYAVSRKKASAFQQMPFSGGDEEDRFSARTARPGHPRSRQSTGLSLCTAPTSIPLSPFCKRTRKKEVPAFLQVLLSGGDEGDRTPYLLNAIQALSQVSYTPMTYSLFAGVRFCVARTPK